MKYGLQEVQNLFSNAQVTVRDVPKKDDHNDESVSDYKPGDVIVFIGNDQTVKKIYVRYEIDLFAKLEFYKDDPEATNAEQYGNFSIDGLWGYWSNGKEVSNAEGHEEGPDRERDIDYNSWVDEKREKLMSVSKDPN